MLEEKNSNQRKISISAIIALICMSVLVIFLIRSFRIIKSQKEAISISLREKETLLKEIHHRVKNNLQVVSSLLNLQTKTTSDANARNALKEGQTRLASMSLIHQRLYSDKNLTGLRIDEYFSHLTAHLFETYNINRDLITLKLEVDDMEMDVDTVVPLGLIVNELITNSLKYAFQDGRQGEVLMSLSRTDRALSLVVQDNGVGIKNVEEVLKGESFGFGLINAFILKLKAKMSVEADQGTRVQISWES